MIPATALKDIVRITLRLAITCLLAGTILGLAFVLTHDAKQRNELRRDERVMMEILGYSKANPAPQTIALHTVWRYVLTQNQTQSIGYLVPLAQNYTLIELDLEGNFVRQYPVQASAGALRNGGDRDRLVRQALGSEIQARFADAMIIVTDQGKRSAFILDGRFPGFKTTIRAKIALDASFSVLGLDILEHEEDPGLGAEIVRMDFRGQFARKTLEQFLAAKVVRTPMPESYREALLGHLPDAETNAILTEHQPDDIYALTGATISSRAVLNGNQALVKKFVYRFQALDRALKAQGIQPTF